MVLDELCERVIGCQKGCAPWVENAMLEVSLRINLLTCS